MRIAETFRLCCLVALVFAFASCWAKDSKTGGPRKLADFAGKWKSTTWEQDRI
jgi:hypothetical protein